MVSLSSAPPVIETTPAGFPDLRVAYDIRPGDLVLHRNAGGLAGWIIERAQRRMLRDLEGRFPHWSWAAREAVVRDAAAYVHASCYGNRWDCYEMTRPHARRIAWADRVKPGDFLLVRRPLVALSDGTAAGIGGGVGALVAEAAARDAIMQTPYPFRELYPFYLWSWGVKKLGIPGLVRPRSVLEVFDGPDADVCSARYWHWCLEAGVPWTDLTAQERIPATHYPAELAVSPRFITVCGIRIVAEPAPHTPDIIPQPAGALA